MMWMDNMVKPWGVFGFLTFPDFVLVLDFGRSVRFLNI